MKSFFHIFLLCLAALFLTNCTSHVNRGKLIQAKEVADSFERGEILPDHSYYFSGSEAQPDAIIGIHNNYTFERGYWKEADISEDKMRTWNRLIENYYRTRQRYYGYKITTPEGNPVGIWYGKYSFTVIKFPQPNTIIIYPPDPAPNERNSLFGSPGGVNFN